LRRDELSDSILHLTKAEKLCEDDPKSYRMLYDICSKLSEAYKTIDPEKSEEYLAKALTLKYLDKSQSDKKK